MYTNTNGTVTPTSENTTVTSDAYEVRRREDAAFEQAVRRMENTSLDDFFTVEWLKLFHREIFGDIYTHAGEFRDEPIRVSWHIPPAHTREAVESEIDKYIADSKKRLALALLKPEAIPALLGFAFWKLTYIAPFADGNGRVANGLVMLLQRRFDLPGLSLYNRLQTTEYARFVEALREYDTGSAAKFFEYLREKLGIAA
jgi:fido (protein-threonine AMPylation protein)